MFNVGDTVVHPQHGAGKVERREARELLGAEREYLTIRILHSGMTIMVPADGAHDAGLRGVMDEDTLAQLVEVLESDLEEPAGSFSRRFRQNRERLKTGDVLEIAAVVRDLTLRDHRKPLSTGERQMLIQARRVLASELAYARGTDEAEALVWLDDVIAHAGVR